MDTAFIEHLARLFERSSLAELMHDDGSTRVRMARSEPVRTAGPPNPAARTAGHRGPAPSAATHHEIRASFPGTFHGRQAPDQPPLVAVGDTVSEGQVIGFLEAMKVGNRSEADRAGRIEAVPFADGSAVEAGSVLFVIAAPGTA